MAEPLHEQSAGQFPQFSPAWQLPLPHATSCTQFEVWHENPDWQVPQLPPQPFEPQVLPAHCGVQQLPAEVQDCPPLQGQSLAQFAQFSPVWQVPLPQTRSSTQLPPVHVEPLVQLPHTPPQPSDPQLLPAQFLVQQAPATQVPLKELVAQLDSAQFAQVSPAASSQLPLPQVVEVTQAPF